MYLYLPCKLVGKRLSFGSLFRSVLIALLFVSTSVGARSSRARIQGERKVWHLITLDFRGPTANETDDEPNPFLDYRLQVTIAGPSGQRYEVPGFFAGNGQGDGSGNIFRVLFTPDEIGPWQYRASFRKGSNVAVSLKPDAGRPAAFDGQSGSFVIDARDPQAPGFLKWGRLEYVGKHYLKFRDGPYWIRGGTDGPENFLAYEGFVNTVPSHRYADHVADWRPGDPDWGDGQGKAIIGAVNYLASRNVNSIYFLPLNIGGDGKDVWPYVGKPDPKGSPENDNLHFDLAKLAQWEIVFDHAQRHGVFLHFVLNEAEEKNKRELDDSELGPERKLYYREMIARFGHHLALQWNLCEEYNIGGWNLGHDRVRQFASYIQSIDPYSHPITVHSARDPIEALGFTFGDPLFSMTSIQIGHSRIDTRTEEFLRVTLDAGRPLPVSMDEFLIDKGKDSPPRVDDANLSRKQKLWPTYFSGGMVEFILAELLEMDSFKSGEKDSLWRYVWHARSFMEQNLPFWEMAPADDLSRGAGAIEVGIGKGESFQLGAQVFAKPGHVYAVYLPKANPAGRLDLSETSGRFQLRWYNPRAGKFEGAKRTVSGGSVIPLGSPPAEPSEDWVVLLQALHTATTPVHFPGADWTKATPAARQVDPAKLDRIAMMLGGDGCVVKDGYMIKTWGSCSARRDWYSSAKPIFSTLLFFAIEQDKVSGADEEISRWGWELKGKDRRITFRHLADMTSNYMQPQAPGETFDYNDYAIALYVATLGKVFGQSVNDAAHKHLYVPLQMQDEPYNQTSPQPRAPRGRAWLSVRDFARLCWFWINWGNWAGKQLLPRSYFEKYMKPDTPPNLAYSDTLVKVKRPASSNPDNYLNIPTFGGGTNQHRDYGAGIYGFNWWFNAAGTLGPTHPRAGQSFRRTWPGAPPDTIMTSGYGGNHSVMIPSLGIVLVSGGGKWKKPTMDPGNPDYFNNRIIRLLADY